MARRAVNAHGVRGGMRRQTPVDRFDEAVGEDERIAAGSFNMDPGMRAPDEFTDVTSEGYNEWAKRAAERGGAKEYATSVEEEEADAEADELRGQLLFALAALGLGGVGGTAANRALGPGARPGLGLGGRNPSQAEWNAMKQGRGIGREGRLAEGARNVDRSTINKADYFGTPTRREWLATKKNYFPDEKMYATMRAQRMNRFAPQRGAYQEGPLAGTQRHVPVHRPPRGGSDPLQDWMIMDTRSGLITDPGMTHLRHKLVELLMKGGYAGRTGKLGNRLLDSRLGERLSGYPRSVGSNIPRGLFSVPPGR